MSTGNTITTADLKRYVADPFAFFADTIVPTAAGDCRLGDCWADFQQEAFRVVASCVKAVAAGSKPPYRGIWCERTKGGSKDSDVGLALLWLLMFSRRPQTIELGADDQDQILETSKAMQAIIRCNPWMAGRVEVQRNKITCEATASEALFLTRDATGSHGSRPTVTVCNELAHCQSEDFICTLMDNSDKMANNLAILATNAGQTQSWQERWRENYRTNAAWWFQKVETVAPWIDRAKVADAKRRNPAGRFARLWQGIWTAPGGDLLSPSQIEKAIVYDEPLFRPEDWSSSFGGLGVDLGVSSHCSAVVALEGSHRERKLRVAKVVNIRPPVRLEYVRDTIVRLGEQFRSHCVALDPWQGVRVGEELKSMGFHVIDEQQTGSVLTRQSGSLLQCFQDNLLELYKGDEGGDLLIRDLYHARIEEKSYGHRVTSGVDEFGHGDRLSALLQILPHCLAMLGTPEPTEDDNRMHVAGVVGEDGTTRIWR